MNGYYPETLGILSVMASSDEEIEDTAAFRALRGAAVGDLRMVRLPAGEREYEIKEIRYPGEPG